LEKQIANTSTPDQAKKLANNNKLTPEELENWNKRRDDVMLLGLYSKFLQNRDLGDWLIDTGDRIIFEDTTTGISNSINVNMPDKYWGIGDDETGKNRLGELLMKVREDLKIYRKLRNIAKQSCQI
jgi:ribA/ribD-fused uncharacterized protein